MKLKDSMLISDSLKKFDLQSAFIHLPYEKYQKKNLMSNIDLPMRPKFKSNTLGRNFKPLELYLETVDTVFDQDGNLFSRNGSVRFIGKAEFSPNQTDDKSYKFKIPKNKNEINENEEVEYIISEIEKYEKANATDKHATYFYKGKQIFPRLNESLNLEKETCMNTNNSINTISDSTANKIIEGIRKKEIALQICRDILLYYTLSKEN